MTKTMEESLVQYGTPLESLDEDNLKPAKALKISDQVVTDDQGKRRFHGAFTGGFSAGYFNSVGSKEGWTPSTFVSSRSKRAEKTPTTINPISYMDEEDLNDFGIASRKIQATSNYDDPKSHNKRNRPDEWSGPIPGQPVLEEILKPVNVTIGMKLLMKLGWRVGQGIGPRISKREKKKIRVEKKIFNKRYNNEEFEEKDDSSSESEDDRACGRLSVNYAPDDVESFLSPVSKSDVFGLGYKPLERGNVLGGLRDSVSSRSFNVTDKRKKLNIKGQAFGIGAFEDEDEDIYSKEDMSDYDFSLGPKAEAAQKKRGRSRWDSQISLMGEVLEGFHLSLKPLPKPKPYPLPSIPSTFKPWHQSYKRRFEKVDGADNNERLSAEARMRLVSNVPSVEVRSGLKKVEENEDSSMNITNISPVTVDSQGNANLDKSATLTSSSGYRPFASYPEKQKRYEAYISVDGKNRKEIFPSHMTDWEREREKEEFMKAQAFSKPLSFVMSSRFTSATFEDKGTLLNEGLTTMKGNTQLYKETKKPSHEVELKPDMKAAKDKLFGKLTQTLCEWHPNRLLCKRFNVPNPYPQSSKVGVQTVKKEKLSIFNFLSEMPPQNSLVMKPKEEVVKEEESIVVEIEEDFGLKVPVSNPPTVDLYKAIFQDSSDSEPDENESKANDDSKPVDNDVIVGTNPNGKNSNSSPEADPKEVEIIFVSRTDKEKENDTFPVRSSTLTRNIRKKDLDDDQLDCETKSRDKSSEPQDIVASKAKGIFKGIDFSALNQYRSLNNQSTSESSAISSVQEKVSTSLLLPRDLHSRKRRMSNKSSSTQSSECESEPNEATSEPSEDDEYGPVLPPHMMRVNDPCKRKGEKSFSLLADVPSSESLKEAERKLKKSKKHKKKSKHKHKKKKSKKKESKRSK